MTTAAQIIAKNRRALVLRGFSPTDRNMLELMARKPGLSIAAYGRILGIQRQNAWRAVQRLQFFGALARFGRLCIIQAKWIERLTVEAANGRWQHLRKLQERKRLERAKALEQVAKSEHVISKTTHTGTDLSNGETQEQRLERLGQWHLLELLWKEQEAQKAT